MAEYCFGIDVGGTSVKCGLLETSGKLIEKWEIPTHTDNDGSSIRPDIAETVLSKIREKGLSMESISGIGIGVPGPVRNGSVSVAVNLHWGETKIEETMNSLTGLRVRAENDANVAALGEMWQGGGAGKKNLILVTLGTGIGGGIIAEGRIVEGAHGAGGEIGHTHVSDDIKEPCNCGNFGCLEQIASATGIARVAKEMLEKHSDIPSVLRKNAFPSARLVLDAYKAGDEVANMIVDYFTKYLGWALSVFACVTDPEVIIIGGGVSKAGQPLLDAISRQFRKDAFSACKNTPLVLARLGNDAGMYGAAYLVSGESGS